MKSWKTTLGGILAGTGTLFAGLFPEWSRYGLFVSGAGTVLLGLAARDNNVSSEDVGIKPAPPLSPKAP